MVSEQCPVCKGSGTYLKISASNRVTGYDEVKDTRPCWLCGGEGTVMKQQVGNNMNLHKYWFKNGGQYVEDMK